MTEQNDRSKNTTRAAIGGLVIISLAAAGFFYAQSKLGPGMPIPPAETQAPGDEMPPEETPNLTITLSDGSAVPGEYQPLPVSRGVPLTDEETAAILARLPLLTSLPGERVPFNLPPEVLPPPRPGATIEEPFPPPPESIAPVVYEGSLEVLRYSPEGEIPIAPFVNVTFNQPMVSLGTLEDLALEDVPVIVEPSLPGTWRWLGTKTLNFQYDSDLIDRMPMATRYTVTIPAGTESAVGGVNRGEPLQLPHTAGHPAEFLSLFLRPTATRSALLHVLQPAYRPSGCAGYR